MRLEAALLRNCWFICGPTACGKSAVALELAPRLPAEIVALDSMTLYRGMDIGTAKPSAADRARVPHHLFDILDPREEFSVAAYLAAAEACCREILSRGRAPLFVGGAGLYLRAVLRGVFEGPPAQPALRRQWDHEAAHLGPQHLHRRLAEIDPIAAARLHPHDVRRIVRALEVHAVTGTPLSAWQGQAPLPPHERPQRVFWLDPPRPWLHERINRRVEEMVQAGLLEEVRRLRELANPLSRTARQALGYKEILDWLDEQPRRPWADVVTLIQARTRQFAKRQCTWFRHLEECRRIPISGRESPTELADRLLDSDSA
jgi:tRNA dimethylallyltransferase